MRGDLHIYYDQEGYYLEISLGNFQASYVRDMNDGVFEHINEKTEKIVGIRVLRNGQQTKKY